MSCAFIRLTQEHESDLLGLFDMTENGSSGFRVSRGTNFFALAEESGETVYYGITKNQKLVACIGITFQARFLEGKPEQVCYLRDLRMDRAHATPVVYGMLIRGVLNAHGDTPRCVFSVILESNRNKHAITAGKRLFTGNGPIGKICHVGFPLFRGSRQCHFVEKISAHEAWAFYREKAMTVDFALADESIFKRENGYFLGVRRNGRLSALCKIVSQENSRQIISTRHLSVAEKLLNAYCSLSGKKGLPGKEQVFEHCYLSFYTSAGEDYRQEFMAYLRRFEAARYCYVFTGLLPEEATRYKGLFMVSFSSGVYAYQQTSPRSFLFPELTLI